MAPRSKELLKFLKLRCAECNFEIWYNFKLNADGQPIEISFQKAA